MRALAASLLLVAACGPPPESAYASLGLALESGLVAQIQELQVTLVPSTATLDCAKAAARCLKELSGIPPPAARVPFSSDGTGQSLSVEIEPGEYLLHVEALGDGGSLVANGCRLRVSLRAGATASETVALQAYKGPACDAGR